MSTESTIDTQLLDILVSVEPSVNIDQSLCKLLIEKVRQDLIKYRMLIRRYESEYHTDFFSFMESDQMKVPSEKTEQDYFDWELAVTMSDELEETLGVLQDKTV